MAICPAPTGAKSGNTRIVMRLGLKSKLISGGRVRPVLPGICVAILIGAAATAIASVSEALSPLVVGVVLGGIVANMIHQPSFLDSGVAICARPVLRAGVVLLGLRLSLGDVATLGAKGLLVVGFVVTVTFFGTQLIGRRLGLSADLSLLVATGYSICGASAIAAVDGVIEAREEEAAYAITLVTLCGTLSIFALPPLGNLLGLHGEAFGIWVGGAVHDVGQVVATASVEGEGALRSATIVKLTRVMLLAPMVALIALRRRRSDGAISGQRPPLVPGFVGGFLLTVLLRSSGALPANILDVASSAETMLLTVAMVGLGMGVRVSRMRELGGRPLALGAISWALVAMAALAGTWFAT